ncbi:MAG TPA: hypothetical protein EYQ64_00470 [Gemmatimonadetes bacterium]|nr:hypothetical protein [Gemmatimonadota bacterium]
MKRMARRGIEAGTMYPISFCAVMVVILAGRTALGMKADDPARGALARGTIDGVLFWGGYAVVLGVLGTVVGIAISAQAVEAVGEVHTALVWGGIKVSLITTIYGLLVLLGGALVWFWLRHWHRRTVLSGA